MKRQQLTQTGVATALFCAAFAAKAATVSAPFHDAGVFSVVTLNSNNSVAQSQHFVSGNGNGNKQSGLTGADGNSIFVNDRNSYLAFDLSAVSQTVTSATLRLWAWAENDGEIIAGVLRSATSENIQFRSVDSHSASDIINAPLGDTGNHAVDVPIFNDLGSGALYGERLITQADEENPGLIASPHPLATTTDADCADGADPGEHCGRWIDIDLSGALADINAENGIFIFGASLEDTSGGGTQQVFSGNVYDLSTPGGNPSSFRTAAPELILTTVPVPAAVWLFGSGLLALVGVARKRGVGTV